jgi:hypothetical protein
MGYREWTKGGSICKANCNSGVDSPAPVLLHKQEVVLLVQQLRLSSIRRRRSQGVCGPSESNGLGLIKADTEQAMIDAHLGIRGAHVMSPPSSEEVGLSLGVPDAPPLLSPAPGKSKFWQHCCFLVLDNGQNHH